MARLDYRAYHTGSTVTVDVSQDAPDENSQAAVSASDGPATDSQPLIGEWLSPPEAEQRLGISERTLYRRIARGRLRKRTLDDGRTEIWVSVPATDAGSHAPSVEYGRGAANADYSTDSDRQQPSERALALMDRFNAALARQVEPLVRELADTRRQLVELAEQTGRLTERTEHLVAERDELLTRIAQLEREVADSRATVSVGQGRVSEIGHMPDMPTGAAVNDSQRMSAVATDARSPTLSGITSGGPADGLSVGVAPERSEAKRPWWRFW